MVSVSFLPIKCSTERLQQSFSRRACPEQSRRDAKTAKKNIFLFLRTWRPLRLAPWNTDSTKIELFVRSAIPQGSPRGVLISTQAEYDPQGVTPRGKSSFIRFPKPKFNGKFQICLGSFSSNATGPGYPFKFPFSRCLGWSHDQWRMANQVISNTVFESPCSTKGESCRFSPLETPSALCPPQEAGFTLNQSLSS